MKRPVYQRMAIEYPVYQFLKERAKQERRTISGMVKVSLDLYVDYQRRLEAAMDDTVSHK